MAHVKSLWRFPVKGLSGEKLSEVNLEEGAYFPNDRLFAIGNGESGFDGSEHLPKQKYIMLARQAKLALIKSKFNDKKQEISLSYQHETITASVITEQGKAAIEAFVSDILESEGVKPLKFLTSPPSMRFTDSPIGFVSMINLETIRALEKEIGKEINPLRFRSNIIIEGLEAFAENNLKNWRIQIGGVLFKVVDRIDRCAATTVNPDTSVRDIMIPAILNRTYGHIDCGIYLESLTTGTISTGETLRLHAPPQMDLPFA
jgi:uncharacterized protein